MDNIVDLGGGCRGCAPPPPKMTCGFLIQLVFCKIKKTTWLIGVEVEQETSAPPPKKNPGSAPVYVTLISFFLKSYPLFRVSFLYCNDACVSIR